MQLTEIADVMANADIGFVPKRNDSFGGEAFSTKIFEFMSLGIPVIVSKTRIDNYYFNNSVVKFFEPDNENDLAKAMLEMIEDHHLRNSMRENALKFINDFKWSRRKDEYFKIIDSPLPRVRAPAPIEEDLITYKKAA